MTFANDDDKAEVFVQTLHLEVLQGIRILKFLDNRQIEQDVRVGMFLHEGLKLIDVGFGKGVLAKLDVQEGRFGFNFKGHRS